MLRIKMAVLGLLVAVALGGGLGLTQTTPTSARSVCPHGWVEQDIGTVDPYDRNGNGFICTKDLPGQALGSGNSSRSAGSEDGGHVPGHVHQDDHQ